MSIGVVRREAQRARPGTCHRCGWSGPVSRVPVRTRRASGLDHSIRRICTECAVDVRVPSGSPVAVGHHVNLLAPDRTRDVA